MTNPDTSSTRPRRAVQLYSVRGLEPHLPALVERIATIGYDGVELTPDWLADDRLVELCTLLPQAGLSVSGALVGADGAAWTPEVADRLRSLGADTLTVLAMGPDRFADRSSVDAAAAQLDRLGESAADLGFRLGYHNHTWELASSIGGRPALEVLFDIVNPRVVAEIDAYWLKTAGADPAELIGRLGERVRLLHLKDGPCRAFDDEMVALGEGDLDVAAVVGAAHHAEWHVVEIDQCAGDVVDVLAASFRYLEGVNGGGPN